MRNVLNMSGLSNNLTSKLDLHDIIEQNESKVEEDKNLGTFTTLNSTDMRSSVP